MSYSFVRFVGLSPLRNYRVEEWMGQKHSMSSQFFQGYKVMGVDAFIICSHRGIGLYNDCTLRDNNINK